MLNRNTSTRQVYIEIQILFFSHFKDDKILIF